MVTPQQSELKRYVGLRNIVTSKRDWKYLMLYEIDGNDEDASAKILHVLDVFKRIETSFIFYSTLHGYHAVGFTPVDSKKWGHWFDVLQKRAPEYFSGQTLRITLKPTEKQNLIEYSFRYPYIFRLARMYARRFQIEAELPIFGEMPIYTPVFEKYWTGKID